MKTTLLLSLSMLSSVALAQDAEPVAVDEAVDAAETVAAEASPPYVPTTTPNPIKHTFANGDASIETWGHLRHIVTRFPDFVVNADNDRMGQSVSLDQRLRVGAAFTYTGLRFAGEWDAHEGQAAGELWNLGSEDERNRDEHLAWTWEAYTPRRISLGITIPEAGVLLEGGLMPATTWGLGILANGGERTPIVGRADRGDRMARFRFTFAPVKSAGQRLPLYFTVGFDRVVEDDTASWAAGQEAYHVIASALWRQPEGPSLGLFYTYRWQREPGETPRPTEVSAIDLFGEIPIQLTDKGWGLRLAAEGALIVGTTERVLTYTDLTSTDVLSGGFAFEADVTAPGKKAGIHLYSGYASATGDPDAGQLQDFTFDRNYNVGMLLFDELSGAIEAATYQQLTDPSESGSPPPGAEQIVTEGSFRRAVYLWPAVSIQPIGWLTWRLGYLAAWSTGPVAQPFYSFRAGGSPRNHLDEPTEGNYLGSELQMSLAFGLGEPTKQWWVRPSLVLQGAVAFPGQNWGGGTLSMLQATVRGDW